MARAHWKFIVRDQEGFVISNASVNVYQPGTSNAFLGTAFTAVSGGSSVTNPIISNSQGEVEAWFSTPQSVDVNITDNSNAAVRAATGAVADFSSFTEQDDIYPPSDDYDTLSINPHGAADHTNVTRSFLLRAEDATLGTGTAFLTVGSGLNISRTVEYSDAASEDAAWTFLVPSDYASGAISVQPIWTPSATDGTPHTVRWVYTSKTISNGGDYTAAGTAVTWTGASAARTINLLVFDTNTSTTITPSGPEVMFSLNVQRLGSDGADTYVGNVRLHGLLVNYTASQ